MIFLLQRKIFKLINKKYYHQDINYYYENPQNVELFTKIRNYKSIKKNEIMSYLKFPILNLHSSQLAQKLIKIAIKDFNKKQ